MVGRHDRLIFPFRFKGEFYVAVWFDGKALIGERASTI
jgi:hypothetical protein